MYLNQMFINKCISDVLMDVYLCIYAIQINSSEFNICHTS